MTTLRRATGSDRAGVRTPRIIAAFSASEKEHPHEEHYFLEGIGTRRNTQSKGVGSAVITPMLERCDAEGMPAYLQSSVGLR